MSVPFVSIISESRLFLIYVIQDSLLENLSAINHLCHDLLQSLQCIGFGSLKSHYYPKMSSISKENYKLDKLDTYLEV